jgi:serine/threonine-protein kinase
MTLRAGEVFAGYTVVGLLGGGGMGEVYLAQHPRLPRQDALKILKADISADEGFRQRFIREADSVAALSHPNIVTVFDRGEFNGKLWIATEYVNGTDAAQLLRDRYPAGMPAVEAAAIAAAIGDALDYAHERGLLHRDVKPANILLSEPDRTGRRRVFLADFGIARPMGDPSGLTATNFTVGTVSYAAPEQLMGADIDGRADQYALAATAFHLLTGKPPFEDSNPIAVISKHLTLPPPQLGALRPDLSGLDHILATAMAKDPNQRYPNCADFTADLTRGASLNPVLPHAPTQVAVPAPVPSTPAPRRPANVVGSSIGDGTAPPVQRINTKSKIALGAASAVGAGVLIAIAAVGLNGKNAAVQHFQSGQSSGSQTRGSVTTANEPTGQSPSAPQAPQTSTPAAATDSAGNPGTAPMRLQNYVTDVPGLLTADQRADVNRVVDQLLSTRNVRLWVVYVDRFDIAPPFSRGDAVAWANQTLTLSGMGDRDAIFAVAAGQRSYAFLVTPAAANGSSDAVDAIRANQIEPPLRNSDWAGAAIAAAQGLETIDP